MNKYLLLVLIGFGLLLASCVPTKDLIYLQKKGTQQENSEVSQIASKPYRLQVSDIISITIKANDPKLVEIFSPKNQVLEGNRTETGLYYDGFSVDDHGNIRMPILEEVNVLGKTLDEVRLHIEERLLKEYFNKEANIFVTVKLSGFRYTINGEVNAPGSKVLYVDKLNIMEAIANAGDITMTGNRHKVTVIRQTPSGYEMHDLDLTDVASMKSPYYYIKPNDYIYVKPLKQKSWGTGKTGIESLSTILSVLTLVTTTLILLRNN
jgi:polysaccharide export outer membrane protein